jgi:hypothetical protein
MDKTSLNFVNYFYLINNFFNLLKIILQFYFYLNENRIKMNFLE